MKLLEYTEEVLEYLEHIGYPYLTAHLDADKVSLAMAQTVASFYLTSAASPRLCAIVIWSLTMNYGMPVQSNEVIH